MCIVFVYAGYMYVYSISVCAKHLLSVSVCIVSAFVSIICVFVVSVCMCYICYIFVCVISLYVREVKYMCMPK